jgi:hypothetical protein
MPTIAKGALFPVLAFGRFVPAADEVIVRLLFIAIYPPWPDAMCDILYRCTLADKAD